MVLKKILNVFAVFIYLFLLSGCLFLGYCVLLGMSGFSQLLYGALVVFLLLKTFIIKKSKREALGTILCIAVMFFWFDFILQKASYENQTWQFISFNPVVLSSTPDHAEFFHVDTNTKLVAIRDSPVAYYRKEGDVVAIHNNFPDVRIFSKITKRTNGLHFDFEKKKFNEIRKAFLPKFKQE